MRFRFCSVLLCAFLLITGNAVTQAQDMPIGYWRSHLPYNHAIGVATDGNTLFAISEKSFFSYNAVSGEMNTYSKVDGMSDINMSKIGYDPSTNTVILTYQNSNIDLYKDNIFYNIPYIKTAPISGARTVNDVYIDNGYAYLSTEFGIVVLNMERKEVKETYVFTRNGQTIPVKSFTADNSFFYAATPKGLYRASRNNPNLQSFSVWTGLDTARSFVSVATVQQKTFVTGTDSLFAVNGNTLQYVFRTFGFSERVDPGKDAVYLSMFKQSAFFSRVYKFGINSQFLDSFQFGHIMQVTEIADGGLWLADQYYGLSKHTGGNNEQHFIPSGPYAAGAFDILPYNKELWVAHGAHGTNDYYPQSNRDGISHLKDGTWTNYRPDNFPAPINTMNDFVGISKDPANGDIYGGTLQNGLIVIHPDGTAAQIKEGYIQHKINEPNTFCAPSTAFDQGGNMWITQSASENEFAVRTRDGQWYYYSVPFYASGFADGMLIDDNNQKWCYSPSGGGVIVYNDNNTPETGSDDTYYRFTAGKGYGNLPSNTVYCIAKDRDNAIWVGTADGIGIISCASIAATGQCDAEIRVVQYDQFPNYLFKDQQVKSIAVDGANRKWIGTNDGLFLVSPDAGKKVYEFNVSNSPLPSNVIQKIAIDPITGDVYIGTDQGMVSYRSTAVEGHTSNDDVVVYPNPVTSNYSGTIAIKGLVTDADVRITDIAGQLVYRTKALGGQAVWNGLDYTGHRPQSGVFLIFITNKDGSQTYVSKLLFQH